MKRRELIAGGTVFLLTGFAGCSDGGEDGQDSDGGDDGSGSDGGDTGEEEVAEIEAILGELVEGDNLHLVVEDIDTTKEIGDHSEAEEGNEFVVVQMAVKNVVDDHQYPMMQTSVRDAEGTSYDRAYTLEATSLSRHPELVPGEVDRGTAAFELPTDATATEVFIDLATEEWGFDSLAVNLQEETEVHSLEQTLDVDLHEFGDAVETNGLEVAVRDFSVKPGVMEYPDEPGYLYEPRDGNEFVVVEVEISNETGNDVEVDPVHQMRIRDGDGQLYENNRGPTRELTDSFGKEEDVWSIGNGESKVGYFPYDVEVDLSPLYWGFIYDLDEAGTKTFWQIR